MCFNKARTIAFGINISLDFAITNLGITIGKPTMQKLGYNNLISGVTFEAHSVHTNPKLTSLHVHLQPLLVL